MTVSHLFEDFGGTEAPSPSRPDVAIEDIEDQKLEAFEKGYQAGWEDAVSAQAETQSFVSSGLARSLQNASFEYHEMRATLNASVEAIMGSVTETILPQIAHASLGAHLQEQVTALARNSLDRNIEIRVAPESEAAVRNALREDLSEPFRLITDPLLAPTQVVLKLDRSESELHLGRAIEDISTAIASFFDSNSNEVEDD